MLEANNIIFSYDRGREPVLDRVNLWVEPGERVGIFSPSGSGKTTLLKILSGYLVPEKGQVLVDGSPLPQRGFCPVQMVWQHPERAVNPRLTMKKILAEAVREIPAWKRYLEFRRTGRDGIRGNYPEENFSDSALCGRWEKGPGICWQMRLPPCLILLPRPRSGEGSLKKRKKDRSAWRWSATAENFWIRCAPASSRWKN